MAYKHPPATTGLRTLHNAMQFNSNGEPVIRVTMGGESVEITGPVSIPGSVEISNEEGNPIPVHAHLFDPTDTEYSAANPFPVEIANELGDPISIDGTVAAEQLGDWDVFINNDAGNAVPITGTVTVQDGGGSITVDGTVGISGPVDVSASFSATNYDAFGRMRVSNPVTIFDSQNRYVDGGQFSNDNSGSGSVTYNANSSGFTLSVTGNGDEVIRQAKRVCLYQPGKSLLIMNTFAFNTPTTNLRQRVGYFTSQNGIFLEADGTDVYIVKRSYTSGSAVDTRIAQSSWNGDTFDGSGASGITLDVSKTQILWTDIEWLGVGSVRVGFVIDGVFHVVHTFHHANSLTDVYMTTASLNCRYEITSTGASGSMRQICSTVISEGGYAPTPAQSHIGNGTIEKRLGAADTLHPLATIRLDPNTPDAVVVPAQIDFLTTAQAYGEVQLVEGTTLTGASFNNNVSSIVETDTSATAMSGGEVVFSALYSSRSEIEFTEVIRKRLQLAREADGTPITLTLAAAATTSQIDVLFKFGWEELSN